MLIWQVNFSLAVLQNVSFYVTNNLKEKKNVFVIVPGGLLLLSLEDVEDDSEPFLDFLNLVEYL